MTLDKIRELYEQQPFRPFTMHLADGRSIPVVSREFIMAIPTGRTIVVCEPDGRLHIVDILMVTDLELSMAGNGKKKGGGRKKKAN